MRRVPQAASPARAQKSSSRSVVGGRGGTFPRWKKSHMIRLAIAQSSPETQWWWGHSAASPVSWRPHDAHRLMPLGDSEHRANLRGLTIGAFLGGRDLAVGRDAATGGGILPRVLLVPLIGLTALGAGRLLEVRQTRDG